MAPRTTSRRSDAASIASRKSKAGSRVSGYNPNDYKLIPAPGWQGFFCVGKVLAYPLDEKDGSSRLFRRVILVDNRDCYSICLPIKTYRGSGCSTLDAKVQSKHSAIYVEAFPPDTKTDESSLRIPIHASKLDLRSRDKPRIRYDERHNLSHTEQVREVGIVCGDALETLLLEYCEVNGLERESLTASQSESTGDKSVKHTQQDESLAEGPEDCEQQKSHRAEKESHVRPAKTHSPNLAVSHSPTDLSRTPQSIQKISTSGSSTLEPSNKISKSSPVLPRRTSTPARISKKPTSSITVDRRGWVRETKPTRSIVTAQATIRRGPTVPPHAAGVLAPVPLSIGPVASAEPLDELKHSTATDRAEAETATMEREESSSSTSMVIAVAPSCRGDDPTSTKGVGAITSTSGKEATALTGSKAREEQSLDGPSATAMSPTNLLGNTLQSLHQTLANMTKELQELKKQQYASNTFARTLPLSPVQEIVTPLVYLDCPPPYTNQPPSTSIAPANAASKDSANLASEKGKGRAVDSITLRESTPPPQAAGYGANSSEDPSDHQLYSHHTYEQHFQALEHNEQQAFNAESSRSASTRKSTTILRSPSSSMFHRDIWLRDRRYESRIKCSALLDTGAIDNFINPQAVRHLQTDWIPYRGHVIYGDGRRGVHTHIVHLNWGIDYRAGHWTDQFIVAEGLPYDVVFGRDAIEAREFFLTNSEMLILTHSKNGKPTDDVIEEAEKHREENQKHMEKEGKRRQEKLAASRRAQAQHEPGGQSSS